MQKLTISRESGNIPKTLAGKDHYSGLIYVYPGSAAPPADFVGQSGPLLISSEAEAREMGLQERSENDHEEGRNILRAFQVNPALRLYIYLTSEDSDPTPVETLQRAAKGELRQVGVVVQTRPTKDLVAGLQRQTEALDAEGMPLSIILAPKVATTTADTTAEDLASLPTDLRGEAPNVSLLIGGEAAEQTDDDPSGGEHSPAIGAFLGVLSKRAVNESVAWVERGRTGIPEAYIAGGLSYAEASPATLEQLDDAGYIYTRTYPGLTGVYFSDSHTLDKADGDYNAIELERTMDKAVRGVRTNLLPELGRPLHLNADGTLRADTLRHLRTVAGRAIEQMEKDGEVDGWTVEIDPDQDVLKTSTLKISIHAVPVGVMRSTVVSIGFTASVE